MSIHYSIGRYLFLAVNAFLLGTLLGCQGLTNRAPSSPPPTGNSLQHQ
jgi:hypothetical protein